MYSEKYDFDIIRNLNTQLNFVEFVKPFLSNKLSLVDLGCGTCRKVTNLALYVKHVDAIDHSETMLKCAEERLKKTNTENVNLFFGDNINTPFQSHNYDVCTSSLSVWSAAEAHRLLKPNGLFFIETLDPEDKIEIKSSFGVDKLGNRGYLSNQTSAERLKYLKASLNPFFDIQNISHINFVTTLSEEGFINLLETTPTVRGFSLQTDLKIVNGLVKNNSVSFTEKRIMIMAKSKTIMESET